MKKIFILSMMAAFVLASCGPKEEFGLSPQPTKGNQFVKAFIDESATRVNMVDAGDVYHLNWEVGDEISVTDNISKIIHRAVTGGSTVADFEWADPEGDTVNRTKMTFWAYYPVNINNKKLPATQNYVEGALDRVPMRGTAKVDTTAANWNESPLEFSFKNLCGAICLNLTTTQADVKVISIVLHASAGLSGAFDVDTAVATAGRAMPTSSSAPVSLKCPEVPIGTTPTPFFISVPDNEYSSFSITVIASDGRTQTRNLKSGETLTIHRSELIPIDLAFDDFQAPAVGETATFMRGTDFNASVKGLVNPDVANYNDDDTTFTKMVFVTESNLISPVNVADASSESPIYVSYDEATATVTVSTPAKQFILPANSAFFFHRMKALVEIEGWDDFDMSQVESLSYFFGHSALPEIKVPAWDFSSLINTRYMFYNAKSETIDVSSMDFSQDTSMYYMFSDCSNMTEVIFPDEVDCTELQTMSGLFRRCSSIEFIDMSSFVNTENLLKFSYVFANCPKLTKVNLDLDLSGCTTATYVFAGTFETPEGKTVVEVTSPGTSYLDFSDFNLRGLTLLNSFFRDSQFSTLDLNWLDVSEVLNFNYCFDRCNNLQTLDITDWTLHDSIVKGKMGYMFVHCPNLGILRLGPGFERPTDCTPEAFFGSTTNAIGKSHDGYLTGSAAGSLQIYCTQEAADWLSQTNLRFLPSAHYDYEVPVTFLNYQTGEPMSVTWKE